MKRLLFLSLALLLAACNDYQTATLTLPDGSLIKARIADTPEKTERGLMFVTDMPQDEGMLFVFDNEQDQLFWMKNTLIDLDIIFIAPDQIVTGLHERVPHTYTYTPDYEVPTAGGRGQYVLELNAGVAEKTGIKPGSRLQFTLNKI